MHTYLADLHVHTVLSPCADIEMIPPLIVSEALARGINLIAISDHNASANVAAVQSAARGTGLVVLPGMEVQTKEEVHILCLFDQLDHLTNFQRDIDQRLPEIENDSEHFGEQFVVDDTGEFIRREERLLLTSVNITFEETFALASRCGGLAIPAHIDRPAFGLIANLGFIPTNVPVVAVEVSRHISVEEAPKKFPQVKGYPILQDGDVHRLEEFLGINVFQMEDTSLSELRKALSGQDGRSFSHKMTVDNLHPYG